MLFLKRILTAGVFFVLLFVGFFLLASLVMGGLAGAQASVGTKAASFEEGYKVGQQAGEEIGRKYGVAMVLGSAGFSALASVGLSFSGVLPWCRRQEHRPNEKGMDFVEPI